MFEKKPDKIEEETLLIEDKMKDLQLSSGNTIKASIA